MVVWSTVTPTCRCSSSASTTGCGRLEYQPCCVQNHEVAFAEIASFADAITALIRMIRRFDIDKRWGDEDGAE